MLGPLASERQPEAYDLCEKHVESFTAPRGWQVIRLAATFEPAPPSEDDLLALADAVRDASRHQRPRPQPAERAGRPGGILPASLTRPSSPDALPVVDDSEITRRGHLRVLRGQKEE